MPFPRTTEQMTGWGYKPLGMGACKKCGFPIDWWETPKGKKMPVNRDTAVPHWETCTDKESGPSTARSEVKANTSILAWLSKNAATCECVVCKKLTGR